MSRSLEEAILVNIMDEDIDVAEESIASLHGNELRDLRNHVVAMYDLINAEMKRRADTPTGLPPLPS